MTRRLRVIGDTRSLHALERWASSVPHAVELIEGVEPSVGDADALLLIHDGRFAPSTRLQGPVLRREDGALVPVGWLPNDDLSAWCEASMRVHQRPPAAPVVALLSQWQWRFLDLCGRLERLLREGGVPAERLSSERVLRRDLLQALIQGPALAVYFGHGRPSGWVGYRGFRHRHLSFVRGEPMAALLSLTCRTASRRGSWRSFSERVVLSGHAAASLGAVGPTLHTDNASWAVGLARALAEGAETVGDVVVRAHPPGRSSTPYRLFGDPLAPLRPADGAQAVLQKILAEAAPVAADALE